MKPVIYAIIIISLTISLSAESVFIKDGSIIEGKIIRETNTELTISAIPGTRNTIHRKNILRILYSNDFKKKQYIITNEGTAIEAHIVFEDADFYIYRSDLSKPEEKKIQKDQVAGVMKFLPDKKILADKTDHLSRDKYSLSGSDLILSCMYGGTYQVKYTDDMGSDTTSTYGTAFRADLLDIFSKNNPSANFHYSISAHYHHAPGDQNEDVISRINIFGLTAGIVLQPFSKLYLTVHNGFAYFNSDLTYNAEYTGGDLLLLTRSNVSKIVYFYETSIGVLLYRTGNLRVIMEFGLSHSPGYWIAPGIGIALGYGFN